MIALAIVVESLFIYSGARKSACDHRHVAAGFRLLSTGWRSSGKIGLCSGWIVRKSELDESWLYRHYGSGRKVFKT
jgi:hypothetical protein